MFSIELRWFQPYSVVSYPSNHSGVPSPPSSIMSSIKTRPFELKNSARDFTLKAQVHSRVSEFYEQVRAMFSEANGHSSQMFREKDLKLKHKNVAVHREEIAVRLRFEKSKEKELKEIYLKLQQRLQNLLTSYSLVVPCPKSIGFVTPGEFADRNSTDTSVHTDKDASVISYNLTPESSPPSPTVMSNETRYETPPKSFRSNDAWTPSFNTPNSRSSQGKGDSLRSRSHKANTRRALHGRLSYGGA